jgi:hypothetical protein
MARAQIIGRILASDLCSRCGVGELRRRFINTRHDHMAEHPHGPSQGPGERVRCLRITDGSRRGRQLDRLARSVNILK